MFKKFVAFETRKWDATKVIELLSKYVVGGFRDSDLNVTSISEDNEIYQVIISCRKKELDRCLNDILALTRGGVMVRNLHIL